MNVCRSLSRVSSRSLVKSVLMIMSLTLATSEQYGPMSTTRNKCSPHLLCPVRYSQLTFALNVCGILTAAVALKSRTPQMPMKRCHEQLKTVRSAFLPNALSNVQIEILSRELQALQGLAGLSHQCGKGA